MSSYLRFVLLLVVSFTLSLAVLAQGDASRSSSSGQPTDVRTGGATNEPNDPLLRVLITKGVLTVDEARTIGASGTASEQRDRLAALLRDKGLISSAEFEAVRSGPSPEASAVSVPVNSAPVVTTKETADNVNPATQTAAPAKIAAATPVRLLGIDSPKREGLIPDIKLGNGARVKVYGIFKLSMIHDSSSPQGNDFPLPLLASDTGPHNSPEFHIRSRGLRLGANFEWLDPAPRTAITGKIEFDFEGDFTRVNNRNISAIRSSQPSIRLAWIRIDRRFNDSTTGFVLFGQDWSPFVSSTMPNTVENTNFGGPGYGAAYTRLPQTRFGLNFKTHSSLQFSPELAIVLPAFGNLPADVSNQLAFGERQGTDSQQPGIQGRTVLQWQLDHAENVAPAQFIISFEHAKREAIVTAAAVPTGFKTAFPSGAQVGSSSNGISAEFQLPTRFVTLVGKYYNGSDLRFYNSGQLLSNFNDTAGLTNTATAASIDGGSTVVFG
ncbi:MAG TPA: hypothetical protein VKB46_00295, partial [Pyrinomonadaceae bacterium]|nr:hypothetical protein [Pyrinomonadaceae bacterium]